MKSSSGGVFFEIAKYVLEHNGLVYGVEFNDKFETQHRYVENVEELYNICGSKYVPSTAGKVFIEIKKYIMEQRLVLFSGTPCQVSALLSFLGQNPSNLITISVACHGVPSLNVWDKYKEYLQSSFHSPLINYTFRSKKHGWHNYSVEAAFANGSTYTSPFSEDLYMKLFVGNISLRPSCYKCKFRGKNAQSDIILADFWRIKKYVEYFDDNKGVSLIIVHSDKGKMILECISSKLELQNVKYDEALYSNFALIKNPMLLRNRKLFFENYADLDFNYAALKYTQPPIWKRLLIRVANFLRR